MPYVLVVDDNRDGADILALLLRLKGYEVTTAYDGPSALAAVRGRPPEVVLLDRLLPGCDGLDLARQIRQEPGMGGAVLVCVTGFAPRDGRADPCCDAYLLKPVELSDLEQILERLAANPLTVVGSE
jgi:CheY-like chemotaxis protein